jgi:hypothetical protein
MSSEQIEQLKKDIQKRINEEEKGVSTYLSTILTQVNVTLQKNASPNLNSLDFAVLRLMMIEYLNNIFNK